MEQNVCAGKRKYLDDESQVSAERLALLKLIKRL